MIGKLKGVIDTIGEDHLVLDVHGVGYLVHCSSRTLQRLPGAGEAAVLAIETHVREDMIRLYGFRSEAEREWFRLLQSVQGVGAKVALGILAVLEPGEVAQAVASGDKAAIARGPGVGPKLAARIISELKDKAPAATPIDPSLARVAEAGSEDGAAPSAVADAVSALVNLGYPQMQASAAIAAAMKSAGENATTQVLIRQGLRELAR